MNSPIMGFNGFFWWIGVVEDRADPLNLGRCRCRIFVIHDADKKIQPTSTLQWAHPSLPINNGEDVVGPREGTRVWGFFADGQAAQFPIMVGVLPHVPTAESDPSAGFNDPNGVYPRIVGEPTTNRLARNENVDQTIVATKEASRDTNVGGTGEDSWSEPSSPYAATYPLNHVYESESGHVIEVDDTPGAERLNRHHKSGTFEEIHPTGDRVVRIVGDNYEIVAGSNFVHVKGDVNMVVDGAFKLKADTMEFTASRVDFTKA